MSGKEDFRAGQRVRIRASADSDFRGRYGVIMHVGTRVCDVRIRYRSKGSKVRSTYIGTFRKEDLELPRRRSIDLATFETGRRRKWTGVAAVGAAILAVAAILGVIFSLN